MSADARIMATLPLHPKTRKLIKRHGQAAAWNLVCLFLFACENKSKGILDGMTVEDIELACDWQGQEGAFVDALVDVKFLDLDGGTYEIHDWATHNSWANGKQERSEAARKSAAARWEKRYAAGVNAFNPQCGSHDTAFPDACDGTAPFPSLPSPNPPKDQKLSSSAIADDSCPHQKIIALYHEVLPMMPAVREWTPARQTKLRTRWKEKADRQSLNWWAGFFAYVAESDFLCGRTAKPFTCNLEWLVSPANFAKVIEGNFENRGVAA
jgi:hypothetical protein